MEPSHYAGTDAIAKQEATAARLAEMGVPAGRAFCAATALKYVERCGRKSGASAAEDMEKAASYLFRAIEGSWPWEAAAETDPVFAADGLPLREGEHVYHVETGAELVVEELPKPGAYQAVVVLVPPASHLTSFDPDQLTHQRPVLDADGNRIEPAMDVWWVCEGDERGIHAEKLHVESIGQDGFVTCDPYNGGTWVELDSSELYVNRPVLDAEGVRIKVGDAVYTNGNVRGDGTEWHVVRISPELSHGVHAVRADGRPEGARDLKPEWVTHERPDSWGRLEEDAGKEACEYFAHMPCGCETSEMLDETVEKCNAAKARDIVRRARALAERGL